MRVFILAGEASGDKLGAALMQGLKQLRPDVSFFGVGGDRMTEQGLDSAFPMDEISIMGIVEILKEYRSLKQRIRDMADLILREKPDVVITIDLPEFSLRLAKLVKEQSNIRTVHYVAPTVWAWRPKRAQKMAAYVDQVLALLPFEPPYMQAAGMQCDFVGHPVVTDQQADDTQAQQFRDQCQITGPMALLLPGSRRSEIARLLPIFKDIAARLHATHPDLRFVMPLASSVADTVTDQVKDWPTKPLLICPEQGDTKRAAFRAADVALAASGTVSLELAASGTPMVIAYDMSWLSRQLISRMLLVDTVTLVNLVAESRTIPEFIGKNCQPTPIAQAITETLANPQSQKNAMQLTMQRLGHGREAPGLRAARAVLKHL